MTIINRYAAVELTIYLVLAVLIFLVSLSGCAASCPTCPPPPSNTIPTQSTVGCSADRDGGSDLVKVADGDIKVGMSAREVASVMDSQIFVGDGKPVHNDKYGDRVLIFAGHGYETEDAKSVIVRLTVVYLKRDIVIKVTEQTAKINNED